MCDNVYLLDYYKSQWLVYRALASEQELVTVT